LSFGVRRALSRAASDGRGVSRGFEAQPILAAGALAVALSGAASVFEGFGPSPAGQQTAAEL
jgi:hypothetical protein